MKRALGLVLVLALIAVGGALAYQAASREQEYRGLLSQGEIALRGGQTFGAIEAFSGAIALRPESMLAHLRRGEAYRQHGDLDAAARDFRRAAAFDPSATRPLDALGDVLYQRRRFSAAADVYQSRLALDDRSQQVAYRLALARYRDGDTDASLAALAQALRLGEAPPEALYLQGLCLRDLRQQPEAAKAFEAAVARSAGMIPAREELAEVYTSLGRHTEALEQLQYIALLDRANTERQVAVGIAQARAGHGELAVLTLGSALEQAPDRPTIYAALGRVWLDMVPVRSDALSKALEALERVASTAAATSDVLTLYGRALLTADQPEAAERILQQATVRYPVDPDAFLAYAEAAERQRHLGTSRSALITYGTLTGMDDSFPARATKIGQLSLRLGEPAAAAFWFQRALEVTPADLRLVALLADAHAQAGDLESAVAVLERGLKRDPVNPLLTALSRRLRPQN